MAGVYAETALEARLSLGRLYLQEQRVRDAESAFNELLNGASAMGNTEMLALAHLGMSQTYAMAGDQARAQEHFQRARQIAPELVQRAAGQ